MQAVIDKIMEAKSVAVLTHLNEDPEYNPAHALHLQRL